MYPRSRKPGITTRSVLSTIGILAAASVFTGSTAASAALIVAPVSGEVQVCVVDPSLRTFTTTTIITVDEGTAALVNGGIAVLGDGECAIVGTASSTGTGARFATTIALNGATLDNVECVSPLTGDPCVGDITTTTGANFFHGSVVQYTLVEEVPPPPEGCTVTRGFILNQLDLLTNGIGKDIGPIVIGGVTLTTDQIRAALKQPVKGDLKVQLTAQLITALANISLGATTNPDVDAAIAAAQTLLSTSSTDNAAISAAIATLTAFNEGLAGAGASLHCTDAEEAVLKDKAPV